MLYWSYRREMVGSPVLFCELFLPFFGPYVSVDELQASASDETFSRTVHSYVNAGLRRELNISIEIKSKIPMEIWVFKIRIEILA